MSSDDDVLSQKMDLVRGLAWPKAQIAASCLSLRMSAATHPFERLRGLLAIIQIDVIVSSLQSDLNGRRTEKSPR